MLQKNTNCPKRRTGIVGLAKLSEVSLPSCSLPLLGHEVHREMYNSQPTVWESQQVNKTSRFHIETLCNDANEPIFCHLLFKFQEVTRLGYLGGGRFLLLAPGLTQPHITHFLIQWELSKRTLFWQILFTKAINIFSIKLSYHAFGICDFLNICELIWGNIHFKYERIDFKYFNHLFICFNTWIDVLRKKPNFPSKLYRAPVEDH